MQQLHLKKDKYFLKIIIIIIIIATIIIFEINGEDWGGGAHMHDLFHLLWFWEIGSYLAWDALILMTLSHLSSLLLINPYE